MAISKEIEDIAMKVPEISDRAKLLSALVKEPEGLISLEEVCEWLEDNHSGTTVRAKAVQKAANRLREWFG